MEPAKQCAALKKRGGRCKNPAAVPSRYCWLHFDSVLEQSAVYEAGCDHGADSWYIGHLFGQGASRKTETDPVDLSELLPPTSRLLRGKKGYTYRPYPLALIMLHKRAEEFELDELARPSPETRLALQTGRIVWERIRRWPSGHSPPSILDAPQSIRGMLATLAHFFVAFEDGRALLISLQSGGPLTFDDERQAHVPTESRGCDVQQRRLSDPPRLWAYFRVAVVATYLHLAQRMEPRGYWGHSSRRARQVVTRDLPYNGKAMELTARAARELEPYWLQDLEPKHVKDSLAWAFSPK